MRRLNTKKKKRKRSRRVRQSGSGLFNITNKLVKGLSDPMLGYKLLQLRNSFI